MCLGTSHITVAAVTEQPMFSSFRKTLLCLLYTADEVRIACFSRDFCLRWYLPYKLWLMLSRLVLLPAYRGNNGIRRCVPYLRNTLVFRFPSEKWSLNLVHLSYMVYCLWGIDLPQRLFCFSSPTSDNESCFGRKLICFLVRPSWFPFLLF